MHTIPSLRLQNPICFLPPPVHVYRSSLLLCLCLFLSSFLSENLPLSSSFLRPSSCPLMGLGNSFLQSQGSGHKTMSRLRPLGAPHQRRRKQLFPCPPTGLRPISPGNISAKEAALGAPAGIRAFRSCKAGSQFLWPFLCVKSPQSRPVWEGDLSQTTEQMCDYRGMPVHSWYTHVHTHTRTLTAHVPAFTRACVRPRK